MKIRLQFAVLVLFVCLGASCSKESITDTNNPVALNAVEVEQELLGIVNAHRNSLGVSPMQFSVVAYEYANLHNDYMIAKGNLSHDNFSARASSISAKVDAKQVAENVAKDYPTASATFEGWMNSPNHKETMEADFTHTAISVKQDSKGNFYYTQLFYK